MEISTILYITLALFVALGFAFFQYLFKNENKRKKDYIFFALRAASVFLVLLLLINPEIRSVEYEIDKPELILLADNSQSISFLGEAERLKEIPALFYDNDRLQQNFNTKTMFFGERLSLDDSLNFEDRQTDIYTALTETSDLNSHENSVVVLLTDGNQSQGRDFRYFNKRSGSEILPVIVGDTTRYKDLSIDKINANKYAFLNNRFPVEIFFNYSGKDNIEAEVTIKSGETIIYQEKLELSPDVSSGIIRTDLPASSLGVKTYEVEIQPGKSEKNLINNIRKFAVEVIDERTSVLILSDISHPDLGALQKSVQSNQQRSATIKYLGDSNFEISDYQLVILYQVNSKFNSVITDILENNYNFLIITGSKTDWNFLNNLDLGFSKAYTNQPQEIFPVYNPTFSSFAFEDIGFDDFPPLIDKFGSVKFDSKVYNVLLTQELQGVQTGEPLMAVSQQNPKSGFLLGENLWRWRAKSYLDQNSFSEFDDFLGKLIQNLSAINRQQRLTIDAENFYYANQNVVISAQYFDENYQFDAGRNLKINVRNNGTGADFNSDLLLKNNFYQFDGGDLPPGNYSYNISVQGENLSKSGNFEVIDYNSEQQFVSSNLSGMQSFASNNDTRLYFQDQVDDLINSLLADDKFKPVQKSRQKTVPLIDWYYLLFILISILAVEWFYRKYLGLI
ncbi:VWA domain-containing protein [Christiangramia sabulilitoris]|uniref:VWA domain-containing protein n=1 Tax=Christiangramia sabulilitoris TaxID=2583991 RepID=A0A550I5W6_9FLAO|nr:VWA domain-containing protein [Christiangramia sabulilitoris]TRO66373.1 VWA domain-containing protein [Christiangramia sabulilitoris]